MSRRGLKALAMGLALAIAPAAMAADHLDGPRLTAAPTMLGNLDINDVYVFQGANRNNTVLIMTLSPAAGVLGPAFFNPGGVYEFKVENTGDTAEDLTIQFQFGMPVGGRQPFTGRAILPDGSTALSLNGTTGRNTPVRGGGMVRADLFDDPFFFDLIAFNKFKAAALASDPTAAQVFLDRNVRNIPNNFFGGFNVLAIVLEVPSVRIQASRTNRQIGVWARTTINGFQFDRMARPAINTVLIPDVFKDAFNSATPSQDIAFRQIAIDELTILFGDRPFATAATDMLLPDIFRFDTGNRAGFLNGRRPEDDVIDAELNLLTQGGVKTDNVPNDSVFLSRFPYLGTPNPKAISTRAFRASAAKSAD